MSTDQTDPEQPRAFVCPLCSQPSFANVCGSAVWDGYDEGDQLTDPTQWRLLQCSQCKAVSVDCRHDYGDGFDRDEPEILYPSPRRLSLLVPESLRREFEEAQSCFSAKAYAATVVMVRRVLEGTCHENNVTECILAKGLEKLRENNLIDGTIADWANALRVLGNEGAHYTGRHVPRDDAEDALAFTEALLEHIYA